MLHDSKLNRDEKKLLAKTLRTKIEELKDDSSDTHQVELLVDKLK